MSFISEAIARACGPSLSFNYDNPVDFLKSLDDLLDDFGPEELGNATAQQYLGEFIKCLKDGINASDMPQALKDMANAVLDEHESGIAADMPSSEEASDAVACCAQSDDINESAANDAESATESAGSASEPDLAEHGKAEKNDEKKGRNWLEVLALSLASIQSELLDRATAASDEMQAAIDDDNVGKDSSAFLEAQTEYTTNMQLFNIFSQQVSTSVKTIGEALAAISRKQ